MERKKGSDFDPQLLSLFHKYVHGGISRREFLDSAAKFAVGGLTDWILSESGSRKTRVICEGSSESFTMRSRCSTMLAWHREHVFLG